MRKETQHQLRLLQKQTVLGESRQNLIYVEINLYEMLGFLYPLENVFL